MKNSLTLGAATVALALLAGCGSSSTGTTAGSTSSAATSAAATGSAAASGGASPYSHASSTATTSATASSGGGAMLITSKHDKLGTVLAAGPKKLTVYLFEADKGTASACSGACTAVWPPVTTSAAPQSSAGALASDLGTITRSDGSKQVTYKGHPLYLYGDEGIAIVPGRGFVAKGNGNNKVVGGGTFTLVTP